MKPEYDCIVMGGGPAGSTAAALVAERGYKTLLVEREKVPRYRVGESLVPEAYWVLKRLGVLERVKSAGFVAKSSLHLMTDSGLAAHSIDFARHDPHECSQSWQVERAQFDQILMENAAEKGADCFDQTRVLEVHFEGDRAVGVRLQTAGGQQHDVTARVVVDATGQQALLASALGLRCVSGDLRKAAVWGYYQGANRDCGEHAGDTLLLHTRGKHAWFWYIPLQNDVVSVGVVGDADYLLTGRGTPANIFEEELVNCPAVTGRLVDASLVSKFRVAKEFSYTTQRSAGDGWVLVGDAWGFIDPVFCTGVYFALKSAELAAGCICEGLAHGDVRAAQLGKWIPPFATGVERIRHLVNAFYTRRFSFGRFMDYHPHHEGSLTDLVAGRVFQTEVDGIFKEMQPWLQDALRRVEAEA